MTASDKEAFENIKAWKAKSDIEIRAMLAHVNGKHRDLCLEAQSRIEALKVFDTLDRLYRDVHIIMPSRSELRSAFILLLDTNTGKTVASGATFRDLCVNIVLAGL